MVCAVFLFYVFFLPFFLGEGNVDVILRVGEVILHLGGQFRGSVTYSVAFDIDQTRRMSESEFSLRIVTDGWLN